MAEIGEVLGGVLAADAYNSSAYWPLEPSEITVEDREND
jgi:hypothetical protein